MVVAQVQHDVGGGDADGVSHVLAHGEALGRGEYGEIQGGDGDFGGLVRQHQDGCRQVALDGLDRTREQPQASHGRADLGVDHPAGDTRVKY